MKLAWPESDAGRKKASRQALARLVVQPLVRDLRPCPDCDLPCPAHASPECCCGCSAACPDVSRQMSVEPDAYPIEPGIAPLVFEFYALRLCPPCWSCEGHVDAAGKLTRLPRVWFFCREIRVRPSAVAAARRPAPMCPDRCRSSPTPTLGGAGIERIFSALAGGEDAPDRLFIDSTAGLRVLRAPPVPALLVPPAAELVADKGYDSKALRDWLAERGATAVIPPRKNRKVQYHYDKTVYRQRNIIERMFCRLKDWRRIATRFDRNIRNFIAAIALAAAVIWWL